MVFKSQLLKTAESSFTKEHGAWLNNDLDSSVLFGVQGGVDTAIGYSSFRSYSIEVIGK
ncbi:MAG: hypothetical protein HRT38_07855 [Alteromonadaceae bacterium]|nr:hypothetical protein [Alteromonadaceae bacterium]